MAKKKRFLAKLGMILIKITDERFLQSLEELSLESNEDDQYYSRILEIHNEIEETLRKCPDLKNLSRLGELRKEHFEPFIHHNNENESFFLTQSSSPLSFDVFIPKAERKFAFEVRYDELVIEKAHVLYNGNLFIAYAEIDDDISPTSFGQEIREFLVNHLKTDRWSSEIVPPCPLSPDIMLELVEEKSSFDIIIDDDNDITISLPYSSEKEILDFFEYFLFDISFAVEQFLSASTLNQKLDRYSWEIGSNLNRLSFDYKNLLDLPWYGIKRQIQIMRDIRRRSIKLQILSNDFSVDEIKLRRERDSFGIKNRETIMKSPFGRYFYKYFRFPAVAISEAREAVKLMNDTVANKYLQYYTLTAAILGGIVGAFITNIPTVIKNFYGICQNFTNLFR